MKSNRVPLFLAVLLSACMAGCSSREAIDAVPHEDRADAGGGGGAPQDDSGKPCTKDGEACSMADGLPGRCSSYMDALVCMHPCDQDAQCPEAACREASCFGALHGCIYFNAPEEEACELDAAIGACHEGRCNVAP